MKAKIRSQKGLLCFGAAKSGAKFESKMADKQKWWTRGFSYLLAYFYAYILQWRTTFKYASLNANIRTDNMEHFSSNDVIKLNRKIKPYFMVQKLMHLCMSFC